MHLSPISKLSLWPTLLLALAGCSVDAGEEGIDAGEDVATTSAALTSPNAVFGFDTLAAWNTSSGTKTLSTDSVDGSQALSVGSFWYTELTSQPTQYLGTITDTLAFELKAPAGTSWGNLQLAVSAPSVGVHEQNLGSVNIDANRAGEFVTVSFPVDATLQTKLGQRPADLTFRIRANLPHSTAGYRFDRLRFYRAAKVEVRVTSADDLVDLHVNGLRHRIGRWGQPLGEWRDVSTWFRKGQNDIRLVAEDRGGPQDVGFEMRVDGVLVSSLDCTTATCVDTENAAFAIEHLPSPWLDRPEGLVHVQSNAPGRLYIDDQYQGIVSPKTLRLPPGQYRIGIGQGVETAPNYTGSFYEQTVNVTTSGATVNLTNQAPLGVQNVSSVALLPVRQYQTETGPIAILTQPMIDRFVTQVEATRTKYFKPLSYGLADYQVTVLPMEQDILEVDGNILRDPKYSHLTSQYDIVLVYFSGYDQNGAGIPEHGGVAWASGGDVIYYPSTWSNGHAPNTPAEGLVHEMLHLFEHDQFAFMDRPVGLHGLHGAEEHGYYGENGWIDWYRLFMRGQVGETFPMIADAGLKDENNWPTPETVTPDQWGGTFSSLRYGLNTSRSPF